MDDIRRRFVGQRVAGVPWADANPSVTSTGGVVRACRSHHGLGPHVQVVLEQGGPPPSQKVFNDVVGLMTVDPSILTGENGLMDIHDSDIGDAHSMDRNVRKVALSGEAMGMRYNVLVELPGQPRLLHTVRGVGFIARVDEPKA